MTVVTHIDRCMFEAEGVLWSVLEALSTIEHSGAFSERINKARNNVKSIAADMASNNDQCEEKD